MADDIKRLTVTSTKVIKQEDNWTLYEVFCVGEDGQPIDEKLRSFDDLPINVLKEYKIKRRDDPKHGTSFTLEIPGQKKGAGGGGLKGDVANLKIAVANLEQGQEHLRNLLHQAFEVIERLQGGESVDASELPSLSKPPPRAPTSTSSSPALANPDEVPF